MKHEISREDILEARAYHREFRMSRRDRLASDIERALSEYLGTDSFTGEEYPNLAQSFASVVAGLQVGGGCVSPRDVADAAKELMGNIAKLNADLAALVE